MTIESRLRQGWPGPLRILAARPRLLTSSLVGVTAGLLLTAITRARLPSFLAGWDIGLILYLTLAFHMMANSDVRTMRLRAASQDEGQIAILMLTVAAALASLVAIVAELGRAASGGPAQGAGSLWLAGLAIVLSWAFIHTIFALHYAHEFYDEGERGGGMSFPGGDEEPDYWDFVYFSFVVGMTSQVSDVGITRKRVRRTVVAHGVVAFFFNTALLALTINIAAGAISVAGSH